LALLTWFDLINRPRNIENKTHTDGTKKDK
jgi:hypothetical protein